jgi:hypothetical protein
MACKPLAVLTSGPKIVAFHMYRLSSDTGLAEHLQQTAAVSAVAVDSSEVGTAGTINRHQQLSAAAPVAVS